MNIKYISRFTDFLNENVEWDSDDIRDFLFPITDLGFSYDITKNIETMGTYSGREVTTISIPLNHVKIYSGLAITRADNTFDDDSIWEIIEEICTIRRRLESDKVLLTLRMGQYKCINISYFHKKVIEDDEFKLRSIRDQIRKKVNMGKTEFSYSITTDLKDGKLFVYAMEFTKRKWNLFTKDIDLSKFDVEIIEPTNNYNEYHTTVIISLKK